MGVSQRSPGLCRAAFNIIGSTILTNHCSVLFTVIGIGDTTVNQTDRKIDKVSALYRQ